ncbi:unnamed protein product [Rhodiola kirilowii]
MRREVDVKPDEPTVVSTLSACLALNDLELGKEIHEYVNKEMQVTTRIGWSQSFHSSASLTSLHAVLYSLFRHSKFADAKSLLTSFISTDKDHLLHSSILRPTPSLPKLSKALCDTCIGAYAQMGMPHLAAQIFNKMKRSSQKPKVLTCNMLLNSLVKDTSSHSILFSRKVFDDAVKLGVVPDVSSFNILIYGYCLESRFKEARDVLRLMASFEVQPDNVTYNTILDALFKKGKLNEATDILRDMKDRGLSPNRITFNILVSGYCKMGQLNEVEKLIELMTMNGLLPDVWTYNMLITGMCKEKRIREALKLRGEMESFELLPDVVTYNILINGCLECEENDEASRLLDEMISKGVQMNEVTHNILIKWSCKQGKMDEANDAVCKMEEKGLFPDCITYNTLINGYCKAGDFGKAFKAMANMGTIGLKMDTYTLNTFLNTLCKELKLDEATELLKSAKRRGYLLDNVSYGTLILSHCRKGNIDKALELWDEMKQRKMIPSVVSHNVIIKGLCQSKRTEEARKTLNEMLESGLLPDEITYNTIIHGYCCQEEVEKALQFYNMTVQKKFKPDIFTCNILLHGLCREGMFEKALKLFNTWMSKGTVDVVSYNILICSLSKHGRLDDAINLLDEMNAKNIVPDAASFNPIIKALNEAGRNKEAEEFISNILESDEISRLCKEGKFKDAMFIFREVSQSGANVNRPDRQLPIYNFTRIWRKGSMSVFVVSKINAFRIAIWVDDCIIQHGHLRAARPSAEKVGIGKTMDSKPLEEGQIDATIKAGVNVGKVKDVPANAYWEKSRRFGRLRMPGIEHQGLDWIMGASPMVGIVKGIVRSNWGDESVVTVADRKPGILSMLASSVGKPIRTNGFTLSNENVSYDRYPTEVYAGNEFKKERKFCQRCRRILLARMRTGKGDYQRRMQMINQIQLEISRLCKEGKFRVAMFIFQEMSQSGVNLNRSAYIALMNGLVKRRKAISKEAC